jgi:hypothetical protein
VTASLEPTLTPTPVDVRPYPLWYNRADNAMRRLSALILVTLVACSGPGKQQRTAPTPTAPRLNIRQQRQAAQPALAALRASKFKQAHQLAQRLRKGDPSNAYARLVFAVTSYKKTMHQLFMDLMTIAIGASRTGQFNHRYARSTLTQAEADLATVGEELAAAAQQPRIALELCLACLKVDWNRNGRLDRRDRRFMEIERDAEGNRIPEDDPRRRPVFRFDHGDLAWASAFVSFQRAAIHLLLAYKWPEWRPGEIIDWAEGDSDARKGPLVIKLARPKQIATARRLILKGLDHADRARRSYLAETDDDREWLPNPRQKNHPLPLPVDKALYDTWAGVLRDVKLLLAGEEGLSVTELAQLGDRQWKNPPGGYLNFGRMLADPKDIVFQSGKQLRALLRERRKNTPAFEKGLKEILGDYYVPKMKLSPLVRRLSRMKQEVERGKESLERKLRYLLWLN